MLSIIIVNYKNEERTIRYVKEELVKVSIPHKIIIVNNEASEKGNAVLVNHLNAELITNISSMPNADKKSYVISSPENLGFAKGNNLGAEFSLLHFKIDHFLFSNNDIVFINYNVVEQLLHKIKNLTNVALIGPKVVGLDGENQSPEPYVSFWKRYVWMYWLTPFLTKRKKASMFQLNYAKNAKEGLHYKIMGSFFIVKAIDFVNCGMMDENTFLFGEEVILSERLKCIGKASYYYPQVAVLHEHSQTISKYLKIYKKTMAQFASESYYFRKYRNVNRLSILIGKLSLISYLKLKNIANFWH